MNVAKRLNFCAVFYVVLLHMITGSIPQEQRTQALETDMEESVPVQVRSPHTTMHLSTSLSPCLIAPESADCYETNCRANDPLCIIFLLTNAPEKVRFITSNDYNFKYLGLFSVVDSIIAGLQLAVKECKHQFALERWDCPISTDAILTGPIHSTGTRGISYVQAISAAAVMHSVIKTCAYRENDVCKCGRINKKIRKKYGELSNIHSDTFVQWGGCPDNVRFGEKVSEQFFTADTHTKEMSKITKLSKWHNERVGRMAIRKSLEIKCRCHGSTGSCSIRTCWTVVADFRTVGDLLWEKYERSRLVTDVVALLENKTEKIPKDNLVYSARSPSYCLDNYTAGYAGTVGRECLKGVLSSSRASESSCNIMCCGRDVETIEYKEVYECECKQLWCCTSRCKHCKRKMTKYFCK